MVFFFLSNIHVSRKNLFLKCSHTYSMVFMYFWPPLCTIKYHVFYSNGVIKKKIKRLGFCQRNWSNKNTFNTVESLLFVGGQSSWLSRVTLAHESTSHECTVNSLFYTSIYFLESAVLHQNHVNMKSWATNFCYNFIEFKTCWKIKARL